MAVRLRLKRMGRTHRSFFRLSAMDSRSPRDGRVIEELGWYDPSAKNPDEEVSLKRERIEYWLSVGAQPSDTVRDLLKKKLGISVAS
ncbi:MAG TPA: 30S ribosomal protein S16 [Phycisphaerae bacterium]|nr:30S ribosomal protein S16 [Phycisphaerae bacterium]